MSFVKTSYICLHNLLALYPMRKVDIFQQYIWLLDTIHQARRISFEEINKRWQKSSLNNGTAMHRNTFNRHKDAIQEIFGVNIECDNTDHFKYYIENAGQLDGNTIQKWMLSTITVHHAVQESVSLQQRILLEEIPSGQMFLQSVLDAMKTNHRLSFSYQKYGTKEVKSYPSAEPYCLKLYKQRWYMLVKTDLQLKVFSLDRIQSLDVLDETFRLDPSFDAEAHFRDCFGVYRNEHDHPQKVVLRAFGAEALNLRDLPLHHSQKEVCTTSSYSDFSYHLCPSNDFIGQILRQADLLQVLAPQSLRDKIREIIEKMQKNYE